MHAFRPSAAFEAALHGANQENIAISGRWHGITRNDCLAFCYMGMLCRDVGLTLAGFPDEKNQHVIPRASLAFDAEAAHAIFPFIEVVERQLSERKAEQPGVDDFHEWKMVEVFRYMRQVLVEDVASLETDGLLNMITELRT